MYKVAPWLPCLSMTVGGYLITDTERWMRLTVPEAKGGEAELVLCHMASESEFRPLGPEVPRPRTWGHEPQGI